MDAYYTPLLKCATCGHSMLFLGDEVTCAWTRCVEYGKRYKAPRVTFELDPVNG